MARRASLGKPERSIKTLQEDSGVIIEDFSSVEDVQKVNNEAAPYLKAIIEEVG
jgi:hypothetical protein